MSAEYTPVMSDHFRRVGYQRLNFYMDPETRRSARVLWAARDASTEWMRAADSQDWDAINETMFCLAVFDKAYEL
jgi:hypothetical protein